MDLNKPVSGRMFAKMVGVGSETSVRKAAERGSIEKGRTPDGKYIPLIAAREWGKIILPEYLTADDPKADQPAKTSTGDKPQRRTSTKQKPDPELAAPSADEVVREVMGEKLPHVNRKDVGNVEDDSDIQDDLDDDETEIGDFVLKSEAERRTAILKAKMMQLAYKEKRGEMIPRSKVNAVNFAFGQEIRVSLEGLSNRALDKIMAVDTRHEAKRIFDEEIHETLTLLADILNRSFE